MKENYSIAGLASVLQNPLAASAINGDRRPVAPPANPT
jgi:hypothetical protein